MTLNAHALANADQIASIRRDIHAHPELSYTEYRTANLIETTLKHWGIPTVSGIAKTGVVGIIVGKRPVPAHFNPNKANAIGLRADIDALPLQEANKFTHASTIAGKMHACGHDGHTAMLLGAAQILIANPDFFGTVYLIFQPAEEGGAGAKAMIDEGLFTRFPMDAVFGMHNWPGLPVGKIALTAGAMMASSNEFTITLIGKGAHAAMPDQSLDPIMAAVHLAQALQTVISRNIRPIDCAVLSITQIHAGDAYNIIPNEAVLKGTVRTFSTDVLNMIDLRLQQISNSIAQMFGMQVTIQLERNYPPLINSVAETEWCRQVANQIVGEENILWNTVQTMGAEDFAFMLLKKPGCYIFVGNGDMDSQHRLSGHGLGPCVLHNPSYDFNDALIPIGVSYWVKLVEQWFNFLN